MALSKRALDCLAGMPRHPVPSVEEAAETITRAGFAPHQAWLDFHAAFGGYQEQSYRDVAIWGITQFQSYWYGDREVSVGIIDGRQYIICAEVHPSYSYRRYADGTFYSLGEGFSTTFDVKLERLAFARRPGDGAVESSAGARRRGGSRASPAIAARSNAVAPTNAGHLRRRLEVTS
jgi:hypothetical protein